MVSNVLSHIDFCVGIYPYSCNIEASTSGSSSIVSNSQQQKMKAS
jgi:hypothetical protein